MTSVKCFTIITSDLVPHMFSPTNALAEAKIGCAIIVSKVYGSEGVLSNQRQRRRWHCRIVINASNVHVEHCFLSASLFRVRLESER